GPLVAQWARDERGQQGQRLKKLARMLNEGQPLADALEQVPGILSDEDLLAIRFDSQMGTRTAAVKQLLNEWDQSRLNTAHQVRGDLVYVATVFVVGVIVITFLQFKIVPVFQRMFQEFSYEQPKFLQWSVSIAGTLASFWWLIPVLLLVVVWCT